MHCDAEIESSSIPCVATHPSPFLDKKLKILLSTWLPSKRIEYLKLGVVIGVALTDFLNILQFWKNQDKLSLFFPFQSPLHFIYLQNFASQPIFTILDSAGFHKTINSSPQSLFVGVVCGPVNCNSLLELLQCC